MAARENQGYLIAVIIFVLLSLVLGLVAFMGISKANEYSDDMEQMKKDLDMARKSSEGYQIQSQILQAYIGFKEGGTLNEANQNLTALDNMGEAVKEIRDQAYDFRQEYELDVQKFASNAGGENQPTKSYKALLENFAIVLGRQYNDKQVLSTQLTDVERDRDTKLAAKQAEVDQANKNLGETQKALDEEIETHKTNIAKLETRLDEMQKTGRKRNEEHSNEIQEIQNQVNSLDTHVAKLEDENGVLKHKVDEYEREVFDNPDGRILGVSPEIKMVVVNLGSDDGLRPNFTFAVYSKHVTNFQKDEHKAMIEITRIVGAHQAEARITLENPRDPILTGDYVLTAAWDPGFSVHIALAGEFDLDSDGNSDLTRLINDIQRNGGKVVAYHDENGDIVGKIDASTRFFVRGTSHDPGVENYGKIINSVKALEEQAKEFAVQEIDTKKLLDWMGKTMSAKMERMDGSMGDAFRERTPAGGR